MPGSIRALRRMVDPVRGGGRIPLSKGRSKGRPQFRTVATDTMSEQETAIANVIEDAFTEIPRETLLDALVRRDTSGYAQSVLNRLSDASDAIQRVLLESMIQSGETSAIDLGRELSRQYRQVGKAETPSPSQVALQFRFNATDPRATAWAREESGRLITNMVASEREMFRALVEQSFVESRTMGTTASSIFQQLRTVTPTPTAREFAESIGGNLNGLTTRYERAVMNRVANVADDLAKRGITGTKALETMRKEGDKYATKLRRTRSRTIARTERMMAHNQARLLSYQQAIDSGLMSREHSRKVWSTGPFDVCPICVAMSGVEAKIADPFTLPNGSQVQAPPGHPNCRCTLQTRTDTDLYQPPQNLGTGVPGDPFRIERPGLTTAGREAAGTRLPGIPIPPAAPTTPTSAPAPAPTPEPTQYAIEGIDELRDRARTIRVAIDDEFKQVRVSPSRVPGHLEQAGLVKKERFVMPDGGRRQASARGFLDLQLTDEGDDALDALIEVGRRARRIIDDEIEATAQGLLDDVEARRQALKATRDDLETTRRARVTPRNEAIEAEINDLVSQLPSDITEDLLEDWASESMWDSAGNLQRHNFNNELSVVLGQAEDHPAVYEFLMRREVARAKDRPAVGTRRIDDLREAWETTGKVPRYYRNANDIAHDLRREYHHLVRENVDTTQAQTAVLEAQKALALAERRQASARLEVIERVLADNRPDFGTKSILPRFDRAKIEGKVREIKKAEVIEAIEEYSRRVPAEWVDQYAPGYSMGFVRRGYHSVGHRRIRVSGNDSLSQNGWRSTLHHEFTHGHQNWSPQVNAAERMFLSRRAQSLADDDIAQPFLPRTYSGDPEPRFELNIGDDYATKIYPHGTTELSTRASEYLWYGKFRGNDIDSEVLDWFFGVLLTL